MENNKETKITNLQKNNAGQQNECPKKDKDGNCLAPGTYSDSDEIGGG